MKRLLALLIASSLFSAQSIYAGGTISAIWILTNDMNLNSAGTVTLVISGDAVNPGTYTISSWVPYPGAQTAGYSSNYAGLPGIHTSTHFDHSAPGVTHWTISGSGGSGASAWTTSGSGDLLGDTLDVTQSGQSAVCSLGGAGSGCTTNGSLTAHFVNGPVADASVVVNVVIGGFLYQISGDKNGFQSGSINAAQLNFVGQPWAVQAGIQGGSWTSAAGPTYLAIHTPTIASAPSVYTCGQAIDIAVDAHIGNATPTPSPTVAPGSPTPPPGSPTPTVPITPSPPPSPAPYGSPTPAPGTPPAPNVSTTSPGGGVAGNVIVNNPNDFYGPVRKALEDASLGLAAPGGGDAGGGASGTGTHETSAFGTRGHIDDVEGQLGDAISKKTSIVTTLRTTIASLNSTAANLAFQTFGSATSIDMPFHTLGNATANSNAHIDLPTSINLVPWGGMIDLVRSALLWILRLGFFVLIFRQFASQGATT